MGPDSVSSGQPLTADWKSACLTFLSGFLLGSAGSTQTSSETWRSTRRGWPRRLTSTKPSWTYCTTGARPKQTSVAELSVSSVRSPRNARAATRRSRLIGARAWSGSLSTNQTRWLCRPCEKRWPESTSSLSHNAVSVLNWLCLKSPEALSMFAPETTLKLNRR